MSPNLYAYNITVLYTYSGTIAASYILSKFCSFIQSFLSTIVVTHSAFYFTVKLTDQKSNPPSYERTNTFSFLQAIANPIQAP